MAITDAVRGSEGLTRTERRHERPRLVAARLGMLDESGQLGPVSCLLVGQVRPPLSSPAASLSWTAGWQMPRPTDARPQRSIGKRERRDRLTSEL